MVLPQGFGQVVGSEPQGHGDHQRLLLDLFDATPANQVHCIDLFHTSR